MKHEISLNDESKVAVINILSKDPDDRSDDEIETVERLVEDNKFMK